MKCKESKKKYTNLSIEEAKEWEEKDPVSEFFIKGNDNYPDQIIISLNPNTVALNRIGREVLKEMEK